MLKLENPPYDFDPASRSASASSAQIAIALSSRLFAPQGAKIVELTIARRIDYVHFWKLCRKIRNGAKPKSSD